MKLKIGKIISAAFVGMLMAATVSGCQKEPEAYSHTDFAMGTVTNMTLYGTSDSLDQIEEALVKKVKQVEEEQISWRLEGSQLAKINEELSKNKKTVYVKEPLKTWLQKSLQLSRDSYGNGRNTVDPSIGKLTTLWDFDAENPAVPAKEKIEDAIKGANNSSDHVSIDAKGVVSSKNKDVMFDLGAFGKGIGIDEAKAFLKKQEDVSGAMIALGGSILVYGEKPDGSSWNVGIQNPSQKDGEVLGSVKVSGNTFLSTSGDYEKYFVDKKTGKRYFHILDAKTGYSVNTDITSCTIICDSGLNSDGLSTACFTLGVEGSKELLKKYNAKAIFVDKDKNVYVSEGLDFTLKDESYTMIKQNS